MPTELNLNFILPMFHFYMILHILENKCCVWTFWTCHFNSLMYSLFMHLEVIRNCGFEVTLFTGDCLLFVPFIF